jgi:hypothetical protein
MLDIVYSYARANDYSVQPRLHPYNRELTYEKFLNDPLTVNGVDCTNVALAVGHTSSFLYELMVQGVPIMRYATNAPALKTNSKLEFGDPISFAMQHKQIMSDDFDFTYEGESYVAQRGRQSISLYSSFFNSI